MQQVQVIRVLECIRQGKIGGGESHLLSLVENLDKTKFDPVVLSFTPGPMMEQIASMGISNHVIFTERPFDISKWMQVKRFLREQHIDIIHAHGTRANSNVIWAARSLGIPVIYTIHGWSFHPDQNYFVRNLRILGEKYLTRKAHKNISVSLANQKEGSRYISAFDSTLIENGIDQKKFCYGNKYKDIKLALGIPADRVLVLFLARFTRQKQPLAMVQAFAKAMEVNNNLHLLMVGDGELREEVETLVERLQLRENITLEPFRQDVPAILSSADIYVLPSLWEGLPIGLLEAMAMAKAIIASNVDGTADVVKHRENALLINTENLAEELTLAILDLGSNETGRMELGKNALATVRRKFDVKHMTKRIEDVYTEVFNAKQRKL